jgi:inward rectifier potassium channel
MLSLITLILNTVYGGLLFLKFVAPSAKVEFSQVMTLSNVNGVPCLEFRIGNADGSSNFLEDIYARLTYSFVVEYTDDNGNVQHVAQTQDLGLLHDKRTRLGDLVWTLRHIIDETSPLFGLDFREFPGKSIYHFEACINATQGHTGAPVFCQIAYLLEDVLVGHRFVDQMSSNEDKSLFTVDYGTFNETIPYLVWYPVNRNQHLSFRPPSYK